MEIVQSVLNKARQDKFLLVFDLPPLMREINRYHNRTNKTVNRDSVQFSIFGTIIPEVTVKGVESRFAGSTFYVSSHSKDSPPPVNIKFTVDNNYNNYFTIWFWLNLLHDHKTGTINKAGLVGDGCALNDYMTDLTVYGLDEFGKKRISFKYVKAFPTTLDQITYDQKGDAGVEIESGFTFLYSQMHVELISETND